MLYGSGATSAHRQILTNCWLWIANYHAEPRNTAPWRSWHMWQYCGDGKCDLRPRSMYPKSVANVRKAERNIFRGDRTPQISETCSAVANRIYHRRGMPHMPCSRVLCSAAQHGRWRSTASDSLVFGDALKWRLTHRASAATSITAGCRTRILACTLFDALNEGDRLGPLIAAPSIMTFFSKSRTSNTPAAVFPDRLAGLAAATATARRK